MSEKPRRKLTAYVAARITQEKEARETMNALEELGFTITQDWTQKGYNLSNEAELETFRQEHYGESRPEAAQESLDSWDAATDVDIFVFLNDATGGTTMYWLLGGALKARQLTSKPRRLYMVGPRGRSLLHQHPEFIHVPDLKELVAHLRNENSLDLPGAYQRHHDHHVRLHRQGELSEEDRPNYELAMQREADGLVDPLPEEQ